VKFRKTKEEEKEAGENDLVDEEINNEETEADPAKLQREIFVGNLPIKLGLKDLKKELKRKFATHGNIETIRIRSVGFSNPKLNKKVNLILENFHDKRDSVNAYIRFDNEDSVEHALQEHNTIIADKHIRVDLLLEKNLTQKIHYLWGIFDMIRVKKTFALILHKLVKLTM